MKQQKIIATPTYSSMVQDLTPCPPRAPGTPEYCQCEPLASQMSRGGGEPLLAAPDLDHRLRAALTDFIARRHTVSVLLLHAFQYEGAYGGVQRRRSHASPAQLDQVLANVRRVIRCSDRQLLHGRGGAALLFPGVDQQGSLHILERVYASLDLLQGETFQPPLAREMVIQLGIGSYPAPASSLESFLLLLGRVTRSLQFQPALTRQLHGVRPVPSVLQQYSPRELPPRRTIPFMALPETLPRHLTALLPHKLACELRCVPVGRHQQTLTVALANPGNLEHTRRLQAVTGLTIFPVACEEQVLNRLLTRRW